MMEDMRAAEGVGMHRNLHLAGRPADPRNRNGFGRSQSPGEKWSQNRPFGGRFRSGVARWSRIAAKIAVHAALCCVCEQAVDTIPANRKAYVPRENINETERPSHRRCKPVARPPGVGNLPA